MIYWLSAEIQRFTRFAKTAYAIYKSWCKSKEYACIVSARNFTGGRSILQSALMQDAIGFTGTAFEAIGN